MKALLAIDGSTGSQHVVKAAASRPWPTGTVVCVFSIVDMFKWEGLPTLIEDARRAAKAVVDEAVKEIDYPGREIFSDVQLGFPKKAIVEFARDWKADVIMVGSRGQNALSRFVLGSVAQAVLRSAPCSVEIVRPVHTYASSPGMKILLGTDGSECSAKAIDSLAKRAWPAGSKVKVISVRDLLVL
jgi:nucleotide-binding universal stress UspA family protein